MKEIWKDVKDYEGLYQVSNLGRVKSLEKQIKINGKNQFNVFKATKQYKTKILKPTGIKYLKVALFKNKIRKYFFVHRLVAQAFILNPNYLPQVNHKDENKHNNCVDNLEWCDIKYNCNYGTRNKKIYNQTSFKKRSYPLEQKIIIIFGNMLINSIFYF